MNRNRALDRAVYRRPLPGSRWIFLGSLIMLVWAAGEFVTRADAVDGVTQAYFALVRRFEIRLWDALSVLWETPDARKSILNLLALVLIGVFAVASMIWGRRWRSGFVLIPACVCVFLFHTSESTLLQALNPFELMKTASCAAIWAGSGMNIASALTRRAAEKKRLAKPRRTLSHGTEKTLIPERVTPRNGKR